VTCESLLPWIVGGAGLGEHVLELGAGPGAATQELRRVAPRVTSLEWSHEFAVKLARNGDRQGSVLQGDAASLPFSDRNFSSAIAVLILHHLRSIELQESAFREIFRVLRPGGVLVGFEIQNGWLQRAVHFKSTFVPVSPATISDRLEAAGFSGVTIDFRPGGFGFRAVRAG
jgi:ubiquinone/menaquinone biosynthesis C-methylase UbiE